MDSDFTTGNCTVDRMSRINITGNIIPAAWYKTIRKATGSKRNRNPLGYCILVPGGGNQGRRERSAYWFSQTLPF